MKIKTMRVRNRHSEAAVPDLSKINALHRGSDMVSGWRAGTGE